MSARLIKGKQRRTVPLTALVLVETANAKGIRFVMKMNKHALKIVSVKVAHQMESVKEMKPMPIAQKIVVAQAESQMEAVRLMKILQNVLKTVSAMALQMEFAKSVL